MGQAKRRGNFEQRKAQSINREIKAKLDRVQAEIERQCSLTEDELNIEITRKRKSKKAYNNMNALAAICAASMISKRGYFY